MSFEYDIENDFKELLKGLTENIYAVSSAGDKRKYPCIAIKLDKTEDAGFNGASIFFGDVLLIPTTYRSNDKTGVELDDLINRLHELIYSGTQLDQLRAAAGSGFSYYSWQNLDGYNSDDIDTRQTTLQVRISFSPPSIN